MAKELERTFTSSAQNVGIVDKGHTIPKWYTDTIQNKSNWWHGNDDVYYFYSVNGDKIFIQYGQNAQGWASTIFIVQTLNAKETLTGSNSIEVDGQVTVEMLDSVLTDYALGGVLSHTTVTLNNQVISDKQKMTNVPGRLKQPKSVSIKETIKPQQKSDSTQITMKNRYPNGEFQSSSVTLGLTLFNPNLPQYIPGAIRLNGKWQELDNGEKIQQDKPKPKPPKDNNNDNNHQPNPDPNISKNVNLYNIKYENDNNVNFIYDETGTNPDYPFNRPHLGVDLNFVNEELLTPVRGKAYYFYDPAPSWQGGSGYGNHIIIVSPDGHQYMFGHLSHALIKSGQYVEIGTPIAVTGNSGDSTGAHLHFEVRKNSVASLQYGGTGYTINPAVWRQQVRNGKI